MLAGAILIVGPFGAGSGCPDVVESHECLDGNPIACMDVLGESILRRTISGLQRDGVRQITVLGADVSKSAIPAAELWTAAQQKLEYFGCGETVLLMRLGAYLELDLAQLVQFHRDQRQAITPLYDGSGPLDCWVLESSNGRERNVIAAEAARLRGASRMSPFEVKGYVNRMANAHDVRHLAVDSFLGRCQIRPGGTQIRPGVWVENGAQIHRHARIVAPAYIGRNAKVQADALITRCSNLERGCEVGYATVVEDASILAGSCLGTGLDVSHAVVAGRHLVNLKRDVSLQIDDPQLLNASKIVQPQTSFAAAPNSPEPAGAEVPSAPVSEAPRAPASERKPTFVASGSNAWAG